MDNKATYIMNDKEKLDLACWLNDRYDNLRESVSNRAAIVVSADAILLAGITFLLDKILENINQYNKIEQILLASSVSITFIILTLSIVFAASGIVEIKKTNLKKLNYDLSPSLFFYAYHTLDQFKNASSFEKRFLDSTTKDLLTYALGNLWLMENLFKHLYKNFLFSIKLLLVSIIPFLISAAIGLLGIM